MHFSQFFFLFQANRPMPKEAPEVPVVTLEDSDDDCGWPIKKKK